jgi:hypothetical protein
MDTWQERLRESAEAGEPKPKVWELADAFRDEVAEYAHEGVMNSIASDMINCALAETDWLQLAERAIDDQTWQECDEDSQAA